PTDAAAAAPPHPTAAPTHRAIQVSNAPAGRGPDNAVLIHPRFYYKPSLAIAVLIVHIAPLRLGLLRICSGTSVRGGAWAEASPLLRRAVLGGRARLRLSRARS
ncbi:unnamed protein product, partial [Ectocarpus sp. 12 AP-2014]